MTVEFESELAFVRDIQQMALDKNMIPCGKFVSKLSGGHIKNQTQANKIFVVITIVAFTIAIILLIKYFKF